MNLVFAQNYIDSVLISIKQYRFEEAHCFIDSLDNVQVERLLLCKINREIYGDRCRIEIEPSEIVADSSLLSSREKILQKYLIGNELYRRNEPGLDSLIFRNYFIAFNASKNLKDSVLSKEILYGINDFIFKRSKDSVTSKIFLNKYREHVKDMNDRFRYNYLLINYQFLISESEPRKANNDSIDALFKILNSTVKEGSFEKGLYHQLRGIYYAHWLEDNERSNQEFYRAYLVYEGLPLELARFKIKGLSYNAAVYLHKNGESKKAVPIFLKDLERDKDPVLKMRTYEWLFLSYEELKMPDSALYYFKKMHVLKAKLDQERHSEEIRRINRVYDLEAKQRELERFITQNLKLRGRLMAAIPILGMTILILLFIFYLYRRYKKKSALLLGEKSETLNKLDELKDIVIKNHIILKDGARVYISELTFIKSDGHFIDIHTSDGNRHVDRQKLSEIKKELPPNFIQCHRSYIVNSNYIKQHLKKAVRLFNDETIPISRSFKDNFP